MEALSCFTCYHYGKVTFQSELSVKLKFWAENWNAAVVHARTLTGSPDILLS